MLPAGWLRPKCGHVFALLGVLLFVSAHVEAQTNGNSVLLRGTVSETVVLSVPPSLTQSNIRIDGASSGGALHLTLSGDDAGAPVIRVPLLLRSNIGFRISAAFESDTAALSELSVIEASATGSLVSAGIVQALGINSDVSQPLLVLTGPRVSLGGTLQSPNNALRITLLIQVKPQPHHAWTAHLTLVASAESPVR